MTGEFAGGHFEAGRSSEDGEAGVGVVDVIEGGEAVKVDGVGRDSGGGGDGRRVGRSGTGVEGESDAGGAEAVVEDEIDEIGSADVEVNGDGDGGADVDIVVGDVEDKDAGGASGGGEEGDEKQERQGRRDQTCVHVTSSSRNQCCSAAGK